MYPIRYQHAKVAARILLLAATFVTPDTHAQRVTDGMGLYQEDDSEMTYE